MESVERYNIEAVNNGGDLSTEGHKSSDGAWVKYEDHAAALTAYGESVRAKFAAFADEKGEPKSHCINCGTWWDRKERCPLCMGTHAEMVATKQAAEAAKEKTQ